MRDPRLGAMFRCSEPPELLPAYARKVEALGFDELWLVEDCFFAGAVGTAAAALAATHRIRVGIGILPAVFRNPALAAMELGGLARMFPDRLLAGFGHGVADWMRQVGAFPESQLAALEEVVSAVRALLAGQTVTTSGRHVRLDEVRLDHPPAMVPPVSTGVRGARSLRLSGAVADGTILAELSSPGYVRWARERIDEGRRSAGRIEQHDVTVYALLGSGEAALRGVRTAIARALRANGPARGVDEGLAAEVAELAGSHADLPALAGALPQPYVDQLAITGDPDQCAGAVAVLHEAGADSVVLVPPEDTAAEEPLADFARNVLPLLASA